MTKKPFSFDANARILSCNLLTRGFLVGIPLPQIDSWYAFLVFRVTPANQHRAHFDTGVVDITGGRFTVDSKHAIKGWAIATIGVIPDIDAELTKTRKLLAQLEECLVGEANAAANLAKRRVLSGEKEYDEREEG
jgi:hypothetical protein